MVKAKRDFIEKNGLVVFRLHDHWQARKENDMVTGLAGALGWSAHRVKPDDVLYDIPQATLEATVAQIRSKLNLRAGLRVVGDRKATIRRILLFPAPMHPGPPVAALYRSGPDCWWGKCANGRTRTLPPTSSPPAKSPPW